MKKENLNEFISSINTYENFKNYDNIIHYLEITSEDFIKDFINRIEEYGVNLNNENIEEIVNELENFDYISDIADSEVDIYYSDIYKSTEAFSSFINDAQDEFWNAKSIDKQIQAWQYLFYSEIYNMILWELKEFFENKI